MGMGKKAARGKKFPNQIRKEEEEDRRYGREGRNKSIIQYKLKEKVRDGRKK